ncbi:HET-domain-containing protein [Lentithecium fluviatile CBS 122367]|uniref:HET-domain-containing protein n=1 Tax=Lentithecium fluviatile CBS 122367 TaxID=1168545 RepID=A0A6G1IP13_9PLEO|nr:HET-domain-containing protein [Lentithecium fluviatile CBS 122367]
MKSNPIYSVLDTSRQEIRLIEIISTAPDIVCELSTVSLLGDPAFSALSYVWGDAAVTEAITVNGTPLSVTTNLANAIRDVHYHWTQGALHDQPVQSRRLWADGICINQSDDQEKNHQVPLMKAVYPNAERVLSWLGVGSESTHLGFAFCRTVAQEASMLPPDQNGSVEWMERYISLDSTVDVPELSVAHFDYLTSNPYWTRVWILQEIVLAREVVLVSGTEVLDWRALASTREWLLEVQDRNNLGDRPEYISDPFWLRLLYLDVKTVGQVEYGRKVYQAQTRYHDNTGNNPKRVLTLTGFLLTHQLCDRYRATDPKDYVYGYMGVTRLRLAPDYSAEKKVAAVYCDFVAHWFSECLDRPDEAQSLSLCDLWFLSDAGVGYTFSQTCPDLPSWAPNFAGLSIATSRNDSRRILWTSSKESYIFADYNETPRLVGPSLHCAAILLGPFYSIGPPISFCPDFLVDAQLAFWIRASVLQSPQYRSTRRHKLRAILDIIYRERWEAIDGLDELQQLVTMFSLIIGPRPDFEKIPKERLRTELLTCMAEFCENSDEPLDATNFLPRNVFRDKKERENATHHQWRAYEQSIGLRIAETRDGYLGLFPPHIAEDDVLCLLKGCSVPVVLRKIGSQYQHVGTCYVSGLVDGEVAELVRNGRARIETIEIV